MSIANTDQAERWNSGEDVAHWIANQARYDRMNEPSAALSLAAARMPAPWPIGKQSRAGSYEAG
jgi:hypothetical protein